MTIDPESKIVIPVVESSFSPDCAATIPFAVVAFESVAVNCEKFENMFLSAIFVQC